MKEKSILKKNPNFLAQFLEISKNPELLWDKIARPHESQRGLFYPLETFSAEYFHS